MIVFVEQIALSLGIAAFAVVVFIIWYDRWPRRRLKADEVNAYLTKMQAGRPSDRPEDAERLKRFGMFGQSDDGREFYMLNLIRYRKDAADDTGAHSRSGVPDVHRDYLRAWGRVARPRASHLIYRGKPILKLFGLPDQQRWDAVAIMRYRSRRDLFAIVTDPAFARDAALKNVAVEYTDVYPSGVGFFIASPRLILFLVAVILSFAVLNGFL